jgi:hypothetical protein
MDKCYKTKLFQIQKQQIPIKQEVHKPDETQVFVSDNILYMKTCFYKSELDKFVKYINDTFPDVNNR